MMVTVSVMLIIQIELLSHEYQYEEQTINDSEINKAVYTTTFVAAGWAGAVMSWAGAVLI